MLRVVKEWRAMGEVHNIKTEATRKVYVEAQL